MDLQKLNSVLALEPAYRLQQVRQAIWHDLIDDWSKASVLPLKLRQTLNTTCPLSLKSKFFVGRDTVKALLYLADGPVVETVLMAHRDGRRTVCLSSQVGCPMGCLFCLTGQGGFERNLTVGEILDQVLLMARYLKTKNESITNLVFMGMGEPLLNYPAVKEALQIIHDPEGFNLGWRHISLSTCGLTDVFEKLATDFPQINLAISLHAPTDELRRQLMPAAGQYPIRRLIRSVTAYANQTGRQVMFEYVLLKDVNDTPAQAEELSKILEHPLFVVNLITYNPTGAFQPSSESTAKKFMAILQKNGLKVTRRASLGADVQGACGQLAGSLR